MKQKYQAIIFDMDDVIIDSMKVHVKLEKAVVKKYKIKAPATVWRKFPGWKIEEIFKYLADNYGGKKIDVRRMVKDKYVRLLKLADKDIKAITGAIKFVKQSHKSFAKTALVTSSEKEFCDFILKKFSLNNDFDLAITAEDFKRGKPSPEAYLKAVKLLKIKPNQAMVIEDAVNGIVSAKAAGCLAIGITTTFPRSRLIDAGANYVVKNYSELKSLIRKIL